MQEIIVNVNENNDKTICLVENGKLVEKYEETNEQKRLEGNIYIGKVQNILVGMQAAFVDIGEEKNTFIHIRDIIPKTSSETGNKNESLSKHDIKNYIKQGDSILVQVKRDSTSKKGARISTHISLSGRFVVVMPKAQFVTISQKIENEEEKQRLKQIVKNELPEGFGAIVRTSACGKSEEEIVKDLKKVIEQLNSIIKQYEETKRKAETSPQLLYQNDGILPKLFIDVIDQEVKKIWTNTESEYEKIKKILQKIGCENTVTIELKKDNLLSMYDLDDQLEKAHNRKIWLKCGAFITIDKTEALTAIDVNSGKYIGNKELEQTVFTVNREATIEIAKQIRLRDIGGIIIIDYIDMEKEESKNEIQKLLIENLKKDRSKTQVIGFTPLNLLEMTRKHICSND